MFSVLENVADRPSVFPLNKFGVNFNPTRTTITTWKPWIFSQILASAQYFTLLFPLNKFEVKYKPTKATITTWKPWICPKVLMSAQYFTGWDGFMVFFLCSSFFVFLFFNNFVATHHPYRSVLHAAINDSCFPGHLLDYCQ